MKHVVFVVSLSVVVCIVGLGAWAPQGFASVSDILHTQIIANFGWGYMLAAFSFLVFCIVLAASPYGKIKLGKDHEKPQYSYFGWFSMLFAAGMGIGLIFWGVGEPLSHYFRPPGYIPAQSGNAAEFAMRYSFFHWGFQPWAIYIVMSLSIAYFTFRRDMPPLISSCFYPLWGEKIYGIRGYCIDILAVFATAFGVATSLGLGALQIQSGIARVTPLPDTLGVTMIIIAVVTVMYMFSSIKGLDKGIQMLSRANMGIAALLLAVMFVFGPTAYICNAFTNTLGQYINRFFEMSLGSSPFLGYEWSKSWTLFYWAWWIAWSPFVGLFVARISRGRTIREFILGALLVPSLLTFIWFSVFGASALHLPLIDGIDLSAQQDVSLLLFDVFSHYPFTVGLSIIAIVLLVVFFVTSADSATFVLGMMTSNGDLNPSRMKKIIWGITQSSLAAVLIFIGGLDALQKMTITAALPFCVIMVLLCWSLFKALGEEHRKRRKYG